MLALLIPGVGMGGGQAAALVEVPDVVGQSQASGTTELETALFVVSVATAYSPTIAAGLIISQAPTAGSFAAEGSTVTITVSLGPEPVADEPVGGHYWPGKKVRNRYDDDRIKDKRELRELIERAAGLIQEAIEEPSVAPQAKALKVELNRLKKYTREPNTTAKSLELVQAKVDALIAKSVDNLVIQITDVLTDLIQEIAEDDS